VRILTLIVTLCVGSWLAADAQTTFTGQLQQSKTGEGRVTVTQDKAIEELVNNPPAALTPAPSTTPATPAKPQPTATKTGDDLPVDVAVPDTTDLRRKVMKGTKVNGFRVQVYAGGNNRTDRQKAERTGNEMKTLFPNEPIYVHFYAPRWVCRMGNYRTYEEAHDVLTKVKSLGYPSAVIVKGKITVYYP